MHKGGFPQFSPGFCSVWGLPCHLPSGAQVPVCSCVHGSKTGKAETYDPGKETTPSLGDLCDLARPKTSMELKIPGL